MAEDRGGFRILGKITKRLFPTGKETPKTIPRDSQPTKKVKNPKGVDGKQVGGKPGRKKKS